MVSGKTQKVIDHKKLQAARKAKGLTQTAVAAMLDIEKQRLWMWEHGRNAVPVSFLFALADLYEQTVDSFAIDLIAAPKNANMQITA